MLHKKIRNPILNDPDNILRLIDRKIFLSVFLRIYNCLVHAKYACLLYVHMPLIKVKYVTQF